MSRAIRRQRSEIAAFVVAPQVEAHVRIRIGAEILVVVIDRVAVGRARLLGAADGLIVLRLIHLLRRHAALGGLRQRRRSHDGGKGRRDNKRLHHWSPKCCVTHSTAATWGVARSGCNAQYFEAEVTGPRGKRPDFVRAYFEIPDATLR